jgi:hypothetical protein
MTDINQLLDVRTTINSFNEFDEVRERHMFLLSYNDYIVLTMKKTGNIVRGFFIRHEDRIIATTQQTKPDGSKQIADAKRYILINTSPNTANTANTIANTTKQKNKLLLIKKSNIDKLYRKSKIHQNYDLYFIFETMRALQKRILALESKVVSK